MSNNSEKKWTGKSRGGKFGTWFFVVTLKNFGVKTAYILLAIVVPYFVLFAPKATKSVWHYNRYILNYNVLKSFFSIYSHYYNFGQTIIDKIALKHGITKKYSFYYGNYKEFLELLDSGRGAIIISAHIGSWEVGAPYFYKYGKKINIVMLDDEYKKIKNVIDKGAEEKDYKIIPLGNDGIESIIKIKNAIDNHEYVCLQGDRYMSEKNTIEKEFLNKQANFPKSVFQLATKLGVPVVFYFAMREPQYHYNFEFHIAQMPHINNSSDKVEALLNQYVTILEKIVKKYPRQWFNFYDFWSNYK